MQVSTGGEKINGKSNFVKYSTGVISISLAGRNKILFINSKFILLTLIGETFENFTNFCFFRESLARERFKNGNSRKFIQ